MCVCVLCSYSVVETKNHTRMRCLKIGHPKVPRLIIVSEYSKWPEIGERPHFWAPISTHIPMVLYPISIKSLLSLVILGCIPIKYPHRQTPQLLVTRINDIPHIWSLNPPHIWTQFGSPRVLRGLSWTRHSEYSESQQVVDMANFASNI